MPLFPKRFKIKILSDKVNELNNYNFQTLKSVVTIIIFTFTLAAQYKIPHLQLLSQKHAYITCINKVTVTSQLLTITNKKVNKKIALILQNLHILYEKQRSTFILSKGLLDMHASSYCHHCLQPVHVNACRLF